MSLVVLDGYVYRDTGGIDVLLQRLGAFSEQAVAAVMDACATQLSRDACRLVDACDMGLPVEERWRGRLARGGGAASAAWTEAEDERKTKLLAGQRCPRHDWECTVAIYVMHGQPPLIRLITEKQEVYAPLLEAISGISRFHYDGRIDGPREMSSESRRLRENAWSAIDKDGSLLTGVPLILRPVESHGSIASLALLVANQPTLAERARVIAADRLRDEFFHQSNAHFNPPLLDANTWMTRVIGIHNAWVDHERTETGMDDLASRTNEYARNLMPRLAENDFMRPLAPVVQFPRNSLISPTP